MSKPDIVWHYTAGTYLDKILNDGFLKVSNAERKDKFSKPALFFSADPKWEPTATKMIKNESGEIIQLNFDEMFEHFGLARFGLKFTSELINWAKYKYASKISIQLYDKLEEIGIRQGASPRNWYCLFRDVPEQEWYTVEEWDGCKWISIYDEG